MHLDEEEKRMWTIGELAVLTGMAVEMAEYCEHCEVVAIAVGDKYCAACANELVEYLATQYAEQIAVEGGLY